MATVTALAIKGAKDLEVWLSQTGSEDALLSLALTQIGFGQALGDFIQLVKEDTDASTKLLKDNNDILDSLRAFYNKIQPGQTQASLTGADVRYINEKMKPILGAKWTDLPIPSETDTKVDGTTLNNLIDSVSAKGEQITSESSLNQSTLTASTTRFNQAWDLVTSILKMLAQAKEGPAGNLRM